MDKKNFTSISLQEEMQRSYLEYAMSVIVGRAFLMQEMVLSLYKEESYLQCMN